MWTRSLLKANAKGVLSRTLGLAIVVCILAAILGAPSISGGKVTYERNNRDNESLPRTTYNIITGEQSFESMLPDEFQGGYERSFFERIADFTVRFLRSALGVFMGVVGLVIICWGIFLGGPAAVGRARFFYKSRGQKDSLQLFFQGFGGNRYLNVVGTMFLTNVFVFLWSLLLVIPGIVKSYAYRMVPYILAQNPDISATRAIALSQEMMRGEKWDVFVLDLSFIGWRIVASMLCGLGYIVLAPYIAATEAELFAALRTKALERGVTTIAEIGSDF